MKSKIEPQNLPKHIAIIMDGNGRWANKRLLPRKFGHREGVKNIYRIVSNIVELGVPFVTLYAFSTENKNRPKDEVKALLELMVEYFDSVFSQLVKHEIKLRFMGELDYFPATLQNSIISAVNKSKDFTKGVLNIALNYGSRDEILRAVNIAVKNNKELTQQEFANLLYTKDIPDADVIIRTGGEYRLSNFMMYQAAYSELFFTKTLWPDFDKKELYSILDEYTKRNRRFGKV